MASFLKKNLSLLLAIVAIVCLVGAILILVIPVAHTDVTYKKVLGTIIAVLMLLVAVLCAVYLWLDRDTEPNYFLFDRARKKNISPDQLTFKMVNERLNFLLLCVCKNPEELWQGNVLEQEEKLGENRVFRPLLAYKMLYDLADKNIDTYWEYFRNASPELIDSLADALKQGGETEAVRAFRFIMDNYRNDDAKVRGFICGNMKYFRTRIMSYVKRNIELFY